MTMDLLTAWIIAYFVAPDSRITISLYECPDWGHRELDCFGCYGLPDYLPGTVMPFIGHFFELWFAMLRFAGKLSREEDLGDTSQG